MGKKGSWFSAIKRVFIPSSKEKVVNELDKKNPKKKKWGLGKLRHGETNSFIPLHREPSSIEKILGDAEMEQQKALPAVSPLDQRRTPSMPSFVVHHYEQINQNNNNTSSSSNSNNNNNSHINRLPTSENHHIAAIKIQSIYRGYMARRSFRALKGLVRLQGVVRGQSVKRQTMNAMKYMQLLVKVQTQIQSRRIQTLENQAVQRQNLHKNDKELENNLARWILTSERGQQEDWDDSMLTKEEIDARLQRKVEAIIKRERAMAYVHSHQLLKATPKTAQTALMEIRSGGFPWWWNWIERQLPENHSEVQSTQAKDDRFSEFQSTQTKTNLTPHKLTHDPYTRPGSSNSKQPSFRFENIETVTPRSLKSPVAAMAKTKQEPVLSSRASPANKSTPVNHSKPRSINRGEFPLRDDDSLTSCPPFSVPNYMTPTVSAKAKVRSHSNPKDRLPATPIRDQKRRLSFPLTQSIGSLRWNKGSLFSSKDSSSHIMLGKNKPVHSIGNLSIDSTVSMPAALGRKPFK
ncbi:IQ motif [Macleaya cordata]|uniref:IQ motif n=1 Tax=Macleaya cordata TaxID=56857 RepID=A0A200Q3V6_MACCD|nr:IQ motif [Macleaya cordata]